MVDWRDVTYFPQHKSSMICGVAEFNVRPTCQLFHSLDVGYCWKPEGALDILQSHGTLKAEKGNFEKNRAIFRSPCFDKGGEYLYNKAAFHSMDRYTDSVVRGQSTLLPFPLGRSEQKTTSRRTPQQRDARDMPITQPAAQ